MSAVVVDNRAELGYGDHTESIVRGAIRQTEEHLEAYQVSMQAFDTQNPSLSPLAQLTNYRLFQLGLDAILSVTTPNPDLRSAKTETDRAILYGTVLGIDIIRAAVGKLQTDQPNPYTTTLQKETPAGGLVYFLSNERLVSSRDTTEQNCPSVTAMNGILENLEVLMELPGISDNLAELRTKLLDQSGFGDPALAKTNQTKEKIRKILQQNPGALSRTIFNQSLRRAA